MIDYTTKRPEFTDVLGTYKFEKQTFLQESYIFKEAPTSFITLRADGTFIANNVLSTTGDRGKCISKNGLVCASGKWSMKIDSVQTSWGNKKPHWGITLTSVPGSLNFIGFLNSSPPYKLIVNYDEPDLDQVMIFSKK